MVVSQGAGILHNGKDIVKIKIDRSTIKENRGPGIILNGYSIIEVTDSNIIENSDGSIQDNRIKRNEAKNPKEESKEIAVIEKCWNRKK